MTDRELLFALTQPSGVAGNELEASTAAQAIFSETCDATIDHNGNMLAVLKNQPTKPEVHVLLDAHVDEIGMIVTGILDDGFITCARVGGVLGRSLLGAEVLIHGKETVYGVVGATPPHLEPADEAKVTDPEKVMIDTGYTKEQLEGKVALGDFISFIGKGGTLLNERLISKAMDDRACCAILAMTAQRLAADPPACKVTFACTVKEETSSQGAATAAFAVAPTIAVALDVTGAIEPGSSSKVHAAIGSGPAIGIAPALNRGIFEKLKAVAEENGIEYTIEVMGGHTRTNAEAIANSRGGVPTGLISLPLRYMHTPGEVCAESDLRACADLLAAYVRTL